MNFILVIKRIFQRSDRDAQQGVALFIVVAAVAMLSLLVVEFTYVSKVNHIMSANSMDRVKALYMAKTGFKLSLLRLKAYQHVRSLGDAKGKNGGSSPLASIAKAIPQGVIEKIWSFPLIFPIPENAPGVTIAGRERLKKFKEESSLDGSFTAVIESVSSKYNLNLLLAPFAPEPKPSPSSTASPTPSPTATSTPTTEDDGDPDTNPSPTPSFDPELARKSLSDFLGQILQNKIENDPDFEDQFRNFRLEDLVDGIVSWADVTYEARSPQSDHPVAIKKAPFYSISELHMVPYMEDELYELFSSSLTAGATPGINVNTMDEKMLRALIPNLTDEEVKDFFEHRDSLETDNKFKDSKSFFEYVKEFSVFNGDAEEVRRFEEELEKRNIRIVTNETAFKITVRATVRQATQVLEAWVSLVEKKKKSKKDKNSPEEENQAPAAPPKPDAGLRVHFMRIL